MILFLSRVDRQEVFGTICHPVRHVRSYNHPTGFGRRRMVQKEANKAKELVVLFSDG